MLELHGIVHGNVQGVGFRATARREAEKLHLVGFARNLPDGTVELLVQGSREKLQQFLDQLNKHFANYIEKIIPSFRECTQQYSHFSTH